MMLRFSRVLLFFVFGSMATSTSMMAQQNPQAATATAPLSQSKEVIPGIEVRQDVVYGHKDGMALTYDVFQPKENAKGIGLLFMVSGGWVSTWAPPEAAIGMFKPFLDQGYTLITVRHGSSPRYIVPEVTEDVKLALQHIDAHAADFQIDPKKLGVFGFSAGGHLSLMLGTTTNQNDHPHIAAVCAIFPPTDLAPYVELGNPRREQFPALKFEPSRADAVSPLKQVTADDAPTLLVHGDKDELVPLFHSEKIRDAFEASKVDCHLVVIEGAGHGFDAKGNQVMVENMLRWFEKHLK